MYYLIISLQIICLVCFIGDPALILASTKNCFDIFISMVLPALFPFFILSNLMIEYKIVYSIGQLISPISKKIFHLPGNSIFIILMGYICGSPLSATLIANERLNNRLGKLDSIRLLCFTTNASPLFILSVVGLGLLNSNTIGIYLSAIHYGTNITLGTIWSIFSKSDSTYNDNSNLIADKSIKLGLALNIATKKSLASMTQIFGMMVIFFILGAIITDVGLFHLIPNPAIESLLKGFLEMTLGINTTVCHQLDLRLTLAIISFILAFNGLSIHSQIAQALSQTDITMTKFIFYRIIHGSIAAIIAFYVI